MSSSPVHLKNLERIHESQGGLSPRLSTFLLSGAGIAAVVASGWLLKDRDGTGQVQSKDPLGELISAEKSQAARSPDQIEAADLDFPDLLSDADRRTTALVAVNAEPSPGPDAGDAPVPAPVPADGLPTEVLPAGTLLNATPVTTAPKDELTQLAVEASKVPENVQPAPPGTEGGFQVQVASFKDQAEAERFVLELRARGHQAFRQPANVPGRGLWHRVRIGPFKSKYEAALYKTKLEESERMTALVIDPEKVERQQEIRAAKVAERIRKYGAP